MAKIVYNTEVRKSGYEWVGYEVATERLEKWDPERSDMSKTARAGLLRSLKKAYPEELLLVPVDPSPTAQMTIKPMDTDTWISFYRVAEKTKVGTDNPLPDDEIRAELLKFFKKHGLGNSGMTEFSFMRQNLVLMNDLFLARDEGNMEEVYRLLHEGGLEHTKFNFKDMENFYFNIQAKLSLNSEGKLDMTIECITFTDFILYDFLFSKGVLQRWFTCKHCEEDFQWDRKRDYCSSKCKRRAAYERQLIKGRDK